MSLKHDTLTGCLFMYGKILGREGRADGASTNEDTWAGATAKRMGRFLRRTPHSQPPVKKYPVWSWHTDPSGLAPWLPGKWRHSGVSTWLPASLCHSMSALHPPLSHLCMPVGEWIELVQDGNKKFVVHIATHLSWGDVILSPHGEKEQGKISFCRSSAKHKTSISVRVRQFLWCCRHTFLPNMMLPLDRKNLV